MATSQPTSMTTTKTSTLAEDVDKELTCAICLSRYETPKVLPCLHTYCKGCLEDLVKKARDDQVTCPQCKEEHQLPEEGVDGFKTYFTIKNLLELLKVHEAADKSETHTQVIQCSSGLDENDAVAYCSNCCCYLCEACWNSHRKQVFTRNHSTVSLEEIKHSDKPAGAKSLQKVQYCKDHEDEVLKLFCKACKQVICRDCALVKHRDHDFVFIREIRPKIQQQLESLTKDVQVKEVEYKSYIDYVENIREIGTDTLTSCEHEVNDTCHRLQEAIESRRAALIAQLHDIHDLEKKQVNSEADGLQFTLAKLSNSTGFTQQLLANGSDVEVVSMGVQAMQTLENMKQVNWNKDSVKPTLMKVKFDPNFEKYVNEFGVTSHEIQPEDILISGLPKESSVDQELQFKVCLSKEISERGYVATSDLFVQLTHTTTNAETMCNVRKIDLNTWAVSCIPKVAGKYQVSATLDHIETIPLTLEIPEPEAQPVDIVATPLTVETLSESPGEFQGEKGLQEYVPGLGIRYLDLSEERNFELSDGCETLPLDDVEARAVPIKSLHAQEPTIQQARSTFTSKYAVPQQSQSFNQLLPPTTSTAELPRWGRWGDVPDHDQQSKLLALSQPLMKSGPFEPSRLKPGPPPPQPGQNSGSWGFGVVPPIVTNNRNSRSKRRGNFW